jgi:hypothetical protein
MFYGPCFLFQATEGKKVKSDKEKEEFEKRKYWNIK